MNNRRLIFNIELIILQCPKIIEKFICMVVRHITTDSMYFFHYHIPTILLTANGPWRVSKNP